jgi:hypothetical protein
MLHTYSLQREREQPKFRLELVILVAEHWECTGSNFIT